MPDGVIEEDAAQSRPPEAWRFGLLVALCMGALVLLHGLLNRGLPTPQIFADEGGYLGNARFIVSGYGRPASGYYAGYSLFLTPAAFITSAPLTFYRGVLLINAGLSIFAPLLALVLVRQTFKDAPRWVSLVAAGIVAFSPLVFSFVGLALSENALVPVVLAVAVLFARAARDGSLRFVSFASAMAAFAYWVSPRGLIVVAAAFVTVVILGWELRRPLVIAGTGTLIMVFGLVSGQLFERAVKGTWHVGGVSDRKSNLLPSLADPSIWHRWLAGALGRFAYIGATSAGIAVIGLAICVGWFLGRDRTIIGEERRVHRCVGAFAFATPAITLIASSGGFAANSTKRQIDFWYYGRYVEAVAMPALAIGAAWVLSNPSRIRVARAVGMAGASIALAAIAVPLLDSGRPDERHFNRLSVVGLLPFQYVFNHPTLTYQLLIGAAIATALGVLMSAKAWIFGLVTVAVLASGSLIIHAQYIVPNAVGSARHRGLADAVHVLRAHGVSTDCIEIEWSRTYTYWNEYNYRFLLASTRFVLLGGNEPVNCGPLVITSNREYAKTRPDVRLVSMENDAPMQLWIDLSRLTPHARDDLTRAGLFFTGSPCDPLPKGAYKANFAARLSGSDDSQDLDSLRLDIDVGHTGRGAPWLAGAALPRTKGCGRVQVAMTVTDEDGRSVYRNAIGLPRTLFPGEGAHIRTKVAASTGPVPTLRAGHRYELHVRLEQAGVRFIGPRDPIVLNLTA